MRIFNGTSETINSFYNLRLAYSRNGNENEIATGWKAASWSSSEYQRKIFDTIMEKVQGCWDNTDSLLDVGCGVGDFLPYLFKTHYKKSGWNYAGVDISEEVVQEARSQSSLPEALYKFHCGDFLDLEFEKPYEWCVAAGTFNLRLLDSPNQYAYLFCALEKMFNLCNKGVVVTILSDFTEQKNGRFNDLFYYDPSKILNYCLTNITENVVVDHSSLDYQFVLGLYPNNFESRMRERNEKA